MRTRLTCLAVFLEGKLIVSNRTSKDKRQLGSETLVAVDLFFVLNRIVHLDDMFDGRPCQPIQLVQHAAAAIAAGLSVVQVTCFLEFRTNSVKCPGESRQYSRREHETADRTHYYPQAHCDLSSIVEVDCRSQLSLFNNSLFVSRAPISRMFFIVHPISNLQPPDGSISACSFDYASPFHQSWKIQVVRKGDKQDSLSILEVPQATPLHWHGQPGLG